MIVAIIGQTASGKTTLADCLQASGMEAIKEYTTRPTRPGETPRHVHVTDAEFAAMRDAGEFAAHTEYNTVHGVWRYGIRVESLRESPADRVIATNPIHVQQLLDGGYRLFVVFMDIPKTTLVLRALDRGDNRAEVGRRIKEDTPLFERLVMTGGVDLHIADQNMTVEQIAKMIKKF